ncbi:energy-coupling factor transporter transmembrane protein EcfT [Niveibacterium sp. 24ML]|uniref:hypothetical protein n=1 Tax=Niveibacterium sp. 24ML TaxID=2985512 RepID=UPI0022707801|nr:hypothetical protein [Niveibacterium sp. 24ML]MCX9155134.1 energy-coupling factor transporter transmembrane protein EcfT [Niveibacterium sp. 24ML]
MPAAVSAKTAVVVCAVGIFALQRMSGAGLGAASLLLVAVALCFVRERLWPLMRRSRFLFLAVAVLYAFSTPGTLLWASQYRWGPTIEGLSLALLHCSRLAGLIACVALLLGLYSRQSLLGGLYACVRPLTCLGVRVERLVLRALLSFEFVSEEKPARGLITRVLASEAPSTGGIAVPLHVELTPWSRIEIGYLVGALILVECAVRWSQ